MTLIGNTAGKLHVQRQVEDYALRGSEFDDMGFLNFTVETYERRMTMQNEEDDNVEESRHLPTDLNCRYLFHHPKQTTHTRVRRLEDHNFLPNIVGSWLPRRDGEENTKPYYYASMLALLKPWRDLNELKEDCDDWESAFNVYMETACQRDKDVVAGCQYYYDSRNTTGDREVEEETPVTDDSDIQVANDDRDAEDDDFDYDDPIITSVSD